MESKENQRFLAFSIMEAQDMATKLQAIALDENEDKLKITVIDEMEGKVKAKGVAALQPIINFLNQGGFHVVKSLIMSLEG